MTFLVRISDNSYAVEEGAVEEIKDRILVAVRAGGGFIDFRMPSGHPVGVLITPTSPVTVEPLPPPVQPSDGDPNFPDLAFFLDMDL